RCGRPRPRPADREAVYQRRRNIVTRRDGRPVNVARFRGQLFVCATGCCCGRTEDGFAPVPTETFHREWERRRLRNVVHLTIGGCLGPCALANVVMLLWDGQALWFHSINSDALVVALFDYLQGMLEADTFLPPAEPLAGLQFTASAWQARPDGRPIDDRRRYRPPSEDMDGAELLDYLATCPLGRDGGPRRDVADMGGSAAMPRKNGELVFAAPWEGRAFGLAVALSDQGLYNWEEFRQSLITQIG